MERDTGILRRERECKRGTQRQRERERENRTSALLSRGCKEGTKREEKDAERR